MPPNSSVLKAYSVRIDGVSIQVDPKDVPFTQYGQPGSILDIALGHGQRLSHQCGGIGDCTTCHIYVKSGLESCSAKSKDELKQIPQIYGQTHESRLACQCVPDGSSDVEIEIP